MTRLEKRTFPGSQTRALVTRQDSPMKEKKTKEMSDEEKDIDVESDEVSNFHAFRSLGNFTSRSDFEIW